jgi:ketosteroid isomerase-like protein
MDRRQLLAGTGTLLLASALAPRAEASEDSKAIMHLVAEAYDVYYTRLDKQKYRAMLTDDYLLLENGEIMDANADIALMPTPQDEYKRTDRFQFRSVKVEGDTAYAVYFLASDMNDKKNGPRSRKWLESAVLRHEGNSWRIALLHSTRMTT